MTTKFQPRPSAILALPNAIVEIPVENGSFEQRRDKICETFENELKFLNKLKEFKENEMSISYYKLFIQNIEQVHSELKKVKLSEDDDDISDIDIAQHLLTSNVFELGFWSKFGVKDVGLASDVQSIHYMIKLHVSPLLKTF